MYIFVLFVYFIFNVTKVTLRKYVTNSVCSISESLTTFLRISTNNINKILSTCRLRVEF